MRSLSRRREDRSETGGVGTAATNRHPKQACFRLLRLSPACNQNVTFRLPIHNAREGILAPTEPTVHNPKGRESDLNRKTITLIGVLGIAAAMILASVAASAQAKPTRSSAGDLTGAGSTFVSKLVQTWIPKVDSALGIKVTYGPVGSGAGITSITNRTVDFGASDAPLTPDQFAACKSCVQIPWALSATSIPYHLNDAPNRIRLSGPVLANIFLGNIKKWNDPAIQKLNKGKSIPATEITVIHRSDSSGTTFNLTDYLSKVSPAWKSRVGKGTAVDWPTGVGGRGSAGVSAALTSTNGGITYVDVAFSLANHFKFASIRNKAGVYALPGLTGIKSAAATINRVAPDNGGISIVDPSKKQKLAYPICTFTYIIIPKTTSKAADLKKFVNWALTKGQADGPKLLFVPIPKVVLKASLKTTALIHS
jgi:phosphate transport system substrate-binding protein